MQLGVTLIKQNTDALTKDLGRQPQPWEVYLAHQQGEGVARALLAAPAGDNTATAMSYNTGISLAEAQKRLTLNGMDPNGTVGQARQFIQNYVDRHSQMYELNGVPSAQNIEQNYERHMAQLADQAQIDNPGDPTAPERYQQHYAQQAGRQLHAQQIVDQANRRALDNSLTGPNPVKSWQELMSDTAWVDAYNSLFKTDRSIYDKVDKAITTNAMSAWAPAASASTDQLYNQLYGMSVTDRDDFSKLHLMQYYGGMPVSQFKDLRNTQQKIQDRDAAEAARQKNMSASLTAISNVTDLASVSPQSPYYKMDKASPLLSEQQKWNEIVGRFGQAMEDWRQNNGGKIPSVLQEREIAQQILFPQGAPAQHSQLRVETGAGSGEAQDPFSLWVAQLLNENGIAVTDDAISATKERLKRLKSSI